MPFGLELLQLVGGPDPVGGVRDGFGAFAQRELLLEVPLPLLGTVCEELAGLRLDRVRGLAIPVPERLRLRARRFGDLLPALLDVVQLARRFLDVLGFFEVVLRAQRFRLRDQLFLKGGVREPLPLVHFAQLVEARSERAERSLEALDDRVAVGLRHERRRLDRGAEIPGGLVRFAQREVFGGRALVRALDELFQTLKLLPEGFLGGEAARLDALPDARLRIREPLTDRGIERVGFRLRLQLAPFARDRLPHIRGAVVLRRYLFGLTRQLVEPRVQALQFLAIRVTLRRTAARVFEACQELAIRIRRPVLFDGREPFPFAARLREIVEHRLAAQRVDALAERELAIADGREALRELALPRPLAVHLVHRFARRRDSGPEARFVVRRQAERRLMGQLAPFPLGRRELLGGGVSGRVRGERFDACDRRRRTLPPLFERRLARRFRLVECLHHRLRPFRDRLVFRARR